VSIPPLDVSGRVPIGRHITDVTEVEERFVAPFVRSVRREPLYSGWRSRRQAIVAVLAGIQMEWVGGSFASGKLDPDDLDVVTFLDSAALAALPQDEREKVQDLVEGRPISRHAGTHGWLVAVYAPGSPEHERYLRARGYWDDLWSRDYDGTERGFLDVRGDP